jgi:general stress protein YciG
MMSPKSTRGFASLSPEKRKVIGSMGGRMSQQMGGHKFSPEEARAAGRKGALSRKKKREQERLD